MSPVSLNVRVNYCYLKLLAHNSLELYLLDIFRNHAFYEFENVYINYFGFIPTKFLMYKKFSLRLYENQIKKQYNPLFCSYLTGLLEGDGTIIVPKDVRSKGKLNYPSIQITFDKRDLPLAVIIQRELGFGSISKTKGVNAYRFTINNFEGLITMVEIMDGYFRTPKIIKFNQLIVFLNQKFPSIKLPKTQEVDKTKLDSNA